MSNIIAKYNKSQSIIHINEYNDDIMKNDISCFMCGTPLIAKRGEINKHHFAHIHMIHVMNGSHMIINLLGI